ncbi:protease modulator HflK [Sphingomonas sp.]|jgi:membrane protease subunit HflK|uniref:protease modulator HflK n=1 Tax=Sphingomonas sp. TaxID=28214 RepID=UPI002E34C283|nr:protease modulator HflK [Sphingomonas sp.]HEX4694961.1 protease modulator HflK [Sphingomonas sp.]
MSKPKSPWGGGSSSDDGSDDKGESGGGDDAGPRNPWAQPPGGPRRAAKPTALDDLLKRARGNGSGGGGRGGGGFQLPGGGNARTLWGLGTGLVVIAWLLLTSFHTIGTQEIGVVTYFGRYSGTLSPGIRMTLPAPIATVQKINVTGIQTFAFPDANDSAPNLVLTGDGNLVDLSYSVQWNISDPQKYAFELANPDDAVKATAETAIRAIIANSTLDEVLGNGKLSIQTQVAEAMQKILSDYQSGIHIVSVALNNAAAPSQVSDAFKDVTAAQNERQSNITQARGYALQVVANAQGEAARFNGYYAQYKLAPDPTRRRMYYETMESILSKTNKTIVEPRGIAPVLPLPGGRVLTDPGAKAPAAGGQ